MLIIVVDFRQILKGSIFVLKHMARAPTVAEADGKRPDRARECLIGNALTLCQRNERYPGPAGHSPLQSNLPQAAEHPATTTRAGGLAAARELPGPGRNGERDFHGERRKDDTHVSKTDADVRHYRKGQAKRRGCVSWATR